MARDTRKLTGKRLDQAISTREKQLRLRALDTMLEQRSGYNSASLTRRFQRNWNVASGTADEMMLEDVSLLRDRSEDLYRNSPVTKGLVLNNVENIIGSGLRMQSTIDYNFLRIPREEAEIFQRDVELKFNNAVDTVEIDAARKHNFYELQEIGFRAYLTGGEAFALLPHFKRNNEKYGLKIQLLHASRCENPYLANDDLMRQGIQYNKRGEPVEYWFRRNEGYFTNPQDYVKIPAFGKKSHIPNVLHIFKPEFIGQSRGIPFIATIMENLKNMDRFAKNELTSSAVASLFTGFVKSNRMNALDPAFDPSGSGFTSDMEKDYTLEPGAVVQLDPDEDITFANPTQRTNSAFENYMKHYLVEIGMATGIPYEALVKQFNSSFTASKAARIEAWRHYDSDRTWFVRRFNQIVYETWFMEALFLGEINAPGFFEDEDVRKAYLRTVWIGDQQGYIDPTNEINAALSKINNGLSTRTIEAAKNGTDFDTNIAQLAYEKRKLEEAGLVFDENVNAQSA